MSPEVKRMAKTRRRRWIQARFRCAKGCGRPVSGAGLRCSECLIDTFVRMLLDMYGVR